MRAFGAGRCLPSGNIRRRRNVVGRFLSGSDDAREVRPPQVAATRPLPVHSLHTV
jgi:hypothetical protein